METIIEQAIHLETTAEANYREAARSTSDPGAAKILDLLADEESEHAKVLRGMSEPSTLDDHDVLGRAKAWVQGAVEGGQTAISSDAGLLDVLRRAMDIERRTETFYREQSRDISDETASGLFSHLADIEHVHFDFVSSLIEYFDRPNEWIEDAEFGLRAEY